MRITARPAYVVAVLSVLASLAPTASTAQAPEPDGLFCTYDTVTYDPGAQDGTRLVDVDLGPVLMTEADGSPARGTLYCRPLAYTYPYEPTHADAGADVAARGIGVIEGGHTRVRITAGSSQQLALCTRFDHDGDGVTYYWDDVLGEWSTSPSAPCAVEQGSAEPEQPDILDALVCPVLALLFPPTGDVEGIWDCPPYEDPHPGRIPFLGPLPLGCADGIDNDGDGLADYPADPGCASPNDTDEHSFAACDDGADSDGDRYVDYPRDPGCASPTDTDERGTNECDDGIDNDGDHARDYVLDAGCNSPADPTEGTP